MIERQPTTTAHCWARHRPSPATAVSAGTTMLPLRSPSARLRPTAVRVRRRFSGRRWYPRHRCRRRPALPCCGFHVAVAAARGRPRMMTTTTTTSGWLLIGSPPTLTVSGLILMHLHACNDRSVSVPCSQTCIGIQLHAQRSIIDTIQALIAVHMF